MPRIFLIFAWIVIPPCLRAQGQITVAPQRDVQVAGNVLGEVFQTGALEVVAAQGSPENIRFRVEVEMAKPVPNLLVVSPDTGITPARVIVGPNPQTIRTMAGGNYSAIVRFISEDQTPVSIATAVVVVELRLPPNPAIQSITSAASGEATISPRSLVSIRGAYLAPPLGEMSYGANATYPNTYGAAPNLVTVQFNGAPAPLVYLSPGLMNVVAPAALAGQQTAEVVVRRYGTISETFRVAVAEGAPRLFRTSPAGATAGAPQVYRFPNVSDMVPENPAESGGVIVLYATGIGSWFDLPEGNISLTARRFTALPVSLSIGGQPATLIYVGAAPYQPAMLQINAFVPEGLARGDQPVVLKVGDVDNSGQGFTIPVR